MEEEGRDKPWCSSAIMLNSRIVALSESSVSLGLRNEARFEDFSVSTEARDSW